MAEVLGKVARGTGEIRTVTHRKGRILEICKRRRNQGNMVNAVLQNGTVQVCTHYPITGLKIRGINFKNYGITNSGDNLCWLFNN